VSEQAERILVVDDDQSILFLLTKALEKNGYQVDSALDGLEGLNALQARPYALLLTDLMMPNLSGIELLRLAREMDPYLEIVVITAAGSIESAITALRDGNAYDYLLKPLDSVKQVPVVVGRAIAHRRLVMERADLQRQMEANAQQLQALIANVGEAILAASADGQVTLANPAASRLLGQAQLVGKPAPSVLPLKLANTVETWREIAGQSPASLELSWQDDITQLVSLTPFLDQDKNYQGWVMVLRDITSLKRLEAVKTQSLLETINKIRMPIAEAMSALVAINLQLPQDERLSGSLFQLTKTWERIQTWGDELKATVQSDAEWNLQSIKVDPHRILDALQDEQVVRLFKQVGGTLNLQIDAPLPRVRTDPDMLYRLLHDLLQRATMRSPQNGEVRIHTRESRQQVWIEISDDGPPASATDPLNILDQSAADLATQSVGMGLEMARAKSILDRLDGQLWVSGQGARGSTVIICLPVANQRSVE
jgi:PAS domain S-box-containing protein